MTIKIHEVFISRSSPCGTRGLIFGSCPEIRRGNFQMLKWCRAQSLALGNWEPLGIKIPFPAASAPLSAMPLSPDCFILLHAHISLCSCTSQYHTHVLALERKAPPLYSIQLWIALNWETVRHPLTSSRCWHCLFRGLGLSPCLCSHLIRFAISQFAQSCLSHSMRMISLCHFCALTLWPSHSSFALSGFTDMYRKALQTSVNLCLRESHFDLRGGDVCIS